MARFSGRMTNYKKEKGLPKNKGVLADFKSAKRDEIKARAHAHTDRGDTYECHKYASHCTKGRRTYPYGENDQIHNHTYAPASYY